MPTPQKMNFGMCAVAPWFTELNQSLSAASCWGETSWKLGPLLYRRGARSERVSMTKAGQQCSRCSESEYQSASPSRFFADGSMTRVSRPELWNDLADSTARE